MSATITKSDTETSVAGKLHAILDETKSVFEASQLIWSANVKGMSLETIATELVRARLVAMDVFAEEEISLIVSDSKRVEAKRLGVNASKSSVQAYASAYATAVDNSIAPTAGLVPVIFQLKSKGRTAEGLKSAIEDVIAATEDREERASQLTSILRQQLKAWTPTGRVARPEGNTKGESEGSADEVESVTLKGVESAIVTLRQIAQTNWTAKEREQLLEAASDLVAQLIGEVVSA